MAAVVAGAGSVSLAQQSGSIRGQVIDADFDAPVPEATVTIAETGTEVLTGDEGNYLFPEVEPGQYTLIFAKPGYVRAVRGDVVVTAGQLSDVDVSLSGDFAELEEFVVRDLQLEAGTEAALLQLRIDSPALIDSVSADLISRAGAGDAAEALQLVAGASVADGKFAVVRGLPPRYVVSQMNGVRLPSASPDTRAVQLDQFPSDVIESVQVSKSFTPDQQGDASGGAVNIVTKSIPDRRIVSVGFGYAYNTVTTGSNNFIGYEGGGVDYFGMDSSRDLPLDVRDAIRLGDSAMFTPEERRAQSDRFSPTVGISRGGEAPIDYSWDVTLGDSFEFGDRGRVGGLINFGYSRSSQLVEGIDNSIVVSPEGEFAPRVDPDFNTTALFDVTEASQNVQWSGLATIGVDFGDHAVDLLFLHTQDAEDTASFREDSKARDVFNLTDLVLRNQTLRYVERSTRTLQVSGEHGFPIESPRGLTLDSIDFNWAVAFNKAVEDEPDRRFFISQYEELPTVVLFTAPGADIPAPVNRSWIRVEEKGRQYFGDVSFNFTQWTEDEGRLKFGVFQDDVTRTYDQDSFTTTNGTTFFVTDTTDFLWSDVFSSQTTIGNIPGFDTPSAGPPEVVSTGLDIDYRGEAEISATFFMLELPLVSFFEIIGGVRVESTTLTTRNEIAGPDNTRQIFLEQPDGSISFSSATPETIGELADADIDQTDLLPSIGFVLTPTDEITVRGSYARTIARPTFRELAPIRQQEFAGDDIFFGNQNLKLSSLVNYDLRFEWRPPTETLFSFSYFRKDITDPIELTFFSQAGIFAQRTTNYEEGRLEGYEIEFRQAFGPLAPKLEGLTFTANATFIDSEVLVPESDRGTTPFVLPPTRRLLNAPDLIYNLNLTYDAEQTGTKFGVFWNFTGDRLIAGGINNNTLTIPSIFEDSLGTLNISVSQEIGRFLQLTFKAKNVTNPEVREIYKSPFVEGEAVRSSFKEGVDLSLSLTGSIPF